MSSSRFSLLVFVFWSACNFAALCRAQAPAAPLGAPLLTPEIVSQLKLVAKPEISARLEVVPVEGQTFQQAAQVRVPNKGTRSFDAQLVVPIEAAWKKDERLLISFWARSVDAGANETGQAPTEFLLQERQPPSSIFARFYVSATRQWQQWQLPFIAPQEGKAGKSQIAFRVAFDRMTLQLGGIQITQYAPDVPLSALPRTTLNYKGREPDAPWRKAALERIEKGRKADLTLRVTDAQGKAVPDARVQVRMKRHAFPFGTPVKDRLLVGAGANTPDAKRYREVLQQNFNAATSEFLTWRWWAERKEGRLSKQGLQWLREHGYTTVRGTHLIWPGWSRVDQNVKARYLQTAASDKAKAAAVLREEVKQHIAQKMGALKGQISDWNVINETRKNHDLMDILGREAMVEWFKLARLADPKARLAINEFGVLSDNGAQQAFGDEYFNTIKYLLDNGAPLDGIGEQSHFGGNVTPPEQVWDILNRFASFGLPLQITELDIDTSDEALQADYLRDFLTIAFSHPSITEITQWGFWEGNHWKPRAALWRRDWSIKPAGEAYRNLVFKQWWTDAQGTTDAQGDYRTRGFLGDYEVTVTANGRSKTVPMTLAKTGQPLRVALP